MTRLLLINPNISDSVSALIRAEAERSASPGTEIEVLTAPFGVAYIETRFEALIGAYAAAQLAGRTPWALRRAWSSPPSATPAWRRCARCCPAR